MANDSSTGGYLLPTSTPVVEDAALEIILQTLVVGITNLPTQLVRPRWQEVPPVEPDIIVNWCAVGVSDEQPEDGNCGEVFDGMTTTTTEQTIISVNASFYGPDCRSYAQNLRSGLMIAQNREALYFADMALVERPGAITFIPALISERIRRRADVSFRLRRTITMTWPIKPLLSGVVQLSAEREGGDILSTTVTTPTSTNPLTE